MGPPVPILHDQAVERMFGPPVQFCMGPPTEEMWECVGPPVPMLPGRRRRFRWRVVIDHVGRDSVQSGSYIGESAMFCS